MTLGQKNLNVRVHVYPKILTMKIGNVSSLLRVRNLEVIELNSDYLSRLNNLIQKWYLFVLAQRPFSLLEYLF